jgi:hypothetical protein
MDFNTDELDLGLSAASAGSEGPPSSNAGRGGRRPNPVRRGSATPLVPGTRRGSLVPGADVPGKQAPRNRQRPRLQELNLFNFDLRELIKDVLLTEGESRVSYHEYAVFSAPDGQGEPLTPSIMADGADGLRMFREALRGSHGLDEENNFVAAPRGHSRLQGRVRQIIADRRLRPSPTLHSTSPDGLFLTVGDYNTLGLHSGTLPSTQRVTVESMFWNAKKDGLREFGIMNSPID